MCLGDSLLEVTVLIVVEESLLGDPVVLLKLQASCHINICSSCSLGI